MMATQLQVSPPEVARPTEMAPLPSPLTINTALNAAQDANNLGNASPAGSNGTEQFADYVESESGEEQEQEMVQPIFDDVGFETPFKDHKPPTTGTTPLGENSFNHRIHLVLAGGPNYNVQEHVKGWQEESPIKLYPPTPPHN